MASALYNQDILRLATAIPHHGRLDRPDGSADRRSPTCGSRVIVDVRLDTDGRIAELAIEPRACALGQASAALMAMHAIGRNADDLRRATDALRVFLASDDTPGTVPDFWPGIGVFDRARQFPARHPSILLAFDAAAQAAERAADATGRNGEATS